MQRTVRRRTKGSTLPPKTRVVTRGTIFGNPFKDADKIIAAGKFQRWLFSESQPDVFVKEWHLIHSEISKLVDYDFLACYCELHEPCHADVLIHYFKYVHVPEVLRIMDLNPIEFEPFE